MECLSETDDPRKPSNYTLHDFREILVIIIAAVLSDCDAVEDIAFWAQSKEAWLRRFLVLKNGIPSEETFLRIPRALNPKQFEAAFRRWVGDVVGALAEEGHQVGTIAIDSKTVRGLGSAGESAIHMVSAFGTELGIVLGQEKVAPKSNEISAIPELLQALDIKGLLVSIDAKGGQKSIAIKVLARGMTDYRSAGEEREPLAAGRMLVITACLPEVRSTTSDTALARNQLLLALASEIVIPYVADGSPLAALLDERGRA